MVVTQHPPIWPPRLGSWTCLGLKDGPMAEGARGKCRLTPVHPFPSVERGLAYRVKMKQERSCKEPAHGVHTDPRLSLSASLSTSQVPRPVLAVEGQPSRAASPLSDSTEGRAGIAGLPGLRDEEGLPEPGGGDTKWRAPSSPG